MIRNIRRVIVVAALTIAAVVGLAIAAMANSATQGS
jgi:hypothetical protein